LAAVTVLGAGVCGLGAALLLARDGHEVTVLERDSEPVPAEVDAAWSDWGRRGVVQFRQPHFLQARVRDVLDRELPDIRDALLQAGASSIDPIARLPKGIADRAARAGDERFVSVTARRTTTEHVFATAAESEPHVRVRRGVEVVGLTTTANADIAHVTGVRLATGAEMRADLVVDAMGRNSRLPRWLRDSGLPALDEEVEDSGFLYYTRFFRARDGARPPVPQTPFLATPIGTFSLLTLPGDRETWAVSVYASAADRPLTALKRVEAWTAVVAACPLHAHWLDGEPITGVLPMAGVLDRHRRLVVDRRPVATGIALLADSWACTNPSLARGLALGLDHAARLRDTVRAHADDPRELAEAWDDVTDTEFTPWYRATVATDRTRLAEIDRIRSGVPAPALPEDPAARARALLPVAAARDPDLFRAFFEIIGCLTHPREVFGRPGLVEKVLDVAGEVEPPVPRGPARTELLELLRS
jgi:2-polyprenyl-6-methoxyphenol hydroxylase-like FAD-dependent oxidoreductase